ncbi:MAG: hypothetical protein H7834_15760, partial [Magnetococcus sp. YQC-9]
AKNAPRAAFVSVVSAFWKRRSHLARSLAKNYASQSRCGLSQKQNPGRGISQTLSFFTSKSETFKLSNQFG